MRLLSHVHTGRGVTTTSSKAPMVMSWHLTASTQDASDSSALEVAPPSDGPPAALAPSRLVTHMVLL